jgi:hypothetical protein
MSDPTASSGLPPIPPNIGEIATPPLLGYMLNWCLYGTLCVQVYNYYLAFPKDRGAIKALVYTSFFLETVQTVLNGHDAYHMFGVGYGNMLELTSVQLSWFALPVLGGVIAAAVQIFYSYRIWVLSGSNILAGVLVLIALLQGSSAIATGARGFLLGNFDLLQKGIRIPCSIWLVGGAVCDIAIALSLTIILLRADVSFKASQVLVSKLVRLTIETGIVTATVSIITAIFFLIPGKVFYTLTPTLVLARLYSNSMMVMLNSRTNFVGGRSDLGTTVFMSTSSRFNPESTVDFRGNNRAGGVSVQKEVNLRRDNIELATVVDDEPYATKQKHPYNP